MKAKYWFVALLWVSDWGCSNTADTPAGPSRNVPGALSGVNGVNGAGTGASGGSGTPGFSTNPIADGTAAGDPSTGPAQVIPDETKGECGTVQIQPNIMFVPGNLLVVFDRSISMSLTFDMANNTSRLDNAKYAINLALDPLVCPDGAVTPDGTPCIDKLSVALLTFPTYDPSMGVDGRSLSCIVEALPSTEQINWAGVTQFVRSFEPYWASRTLIDGGFLYPGMYPLLFGTPISVAFARANEALHDPNVVGNKAVLFLTDGEETGNCTGGVDPVAQAGDWFAEGIKTYVVSLASGEPPRFTPPPAAAMDPMTMDPMVDGGTTAAVTGDGGVALDGGMQMPPVITGQEFNDMVAQAGGTEKSIYPTSSAALTEEIKRIVFESRGEVQCEVALQDARLTDHELACESGEVFVATSKVPCDQVNRAEGFFVKDDTTIQIVGSFCDRLEQTMMLRADFPCEVLAPL